MADILMVEDDPGIRMLMRKLLATVGPHRLHEATTAQDGMAVLSRQRIDLILLDVVLAKDSTGYGFMAALQQSINCHRLPDTPVFLVSGLPQRELEGLRDTYPSTIRDMFCKPFDIDKFRNAVASHLLEACGASQPAVSGRPSWRALRPQVSTS